MKSKTLMSVVCVSAILSAFATSGSVSANDVKGKNAGGSLSSMSDIVPNKNDSAEQTKKKAETLSKRLDSAIAVLQQNISKSPEGTPERKKMESQLAEMKRTKEFLDSHLVRIANENSKPGELLANDPKTDGFSVKNFDKSNIVPPINVRPSKARNLSGPLSNTNVIKKTGLSLNGYSILSSFLVFSSFPIATFISSKIRKKFSD